ncbi:hypothetical protein MUK42_34621 [Musa troglodytarum]|uniref:Uncharacterized protein n=1 Tax=Musa troglodytarum TaxID=320322 RepID=A0A9E7KF67_9LILI|nr:hypothetical protein MUK42_34621 [Musa troglodytarum]
MVPISFCWSLLETVAAPPYIKGAFCSPSLLSAPLLSAFSLSLARGDLHPFCVLCLYFVALIDPKASLGPPPDGLLTLENGTGSPSSRST